MPPLWLVALLAQQPFVTGDECLFCHQEHVGVTWQKNAHAQTVRPEGNEFRLGSGRQAMARRLKQNGYGRFDLFDGSRWNSAKFSERCVGCHTTAVDPSTRQFTAFGLDCYACHGSVPLEHSRDKSLAWLSSKRRSDARLVVSTCASCHLRGAFNDPVGYVAPADLFAKTIDLSKGESPHIAANVRLLLAEESSSTCLDCHTIHGAQAGTAKHRRATPTPVCLVCHYESGPKSRVKPQPRGSVVCEY